ncbi:uncharacterized protein with ParB-like and HNH nuclease domain [Flavobacterium sp. 28A]|uniref:DUF262 domain-containing protein n=1 Tax=Flavobacterium sp. 28A TaxID=2735895 RepID=UPI00156DC6F3|nr:DUF262 domain-containing protein [Flavobacterium sp. 28A]NRT16962.1 uncharacterized protein with ParB-like and HNH nuclease domain [Flavobacterium sp. 28A]
MEEKNTLELKSIKTIIEENNHFFVDSYQRGYKWDEQQVIDLLNDINEFELGKKGEFYCLQPIVVKKTEGKVELIDGQQRITTIFIILSVLDEKSFKIDYQTRKKSELFLNNQISNNSIEESNWNIFKNEEINNIDNYHLFIAYNVIKKWFLENPENNLYGNLVNCTKVIWYDVKEEIKPQELFARINIGKIPLTNSELIKALFLSSKENNLTNEVKNQIALEWDFIEKELQNDELWYFISSGKENKFTRIDFLLDIIANKHFEDKKQDKLYSFHFFAKKEINLNDEWQKITELFYCLQDWFNDLELYHLVGYQLAVSGKNKIKEVYNKQKSTSKREFNKWVNDEIKKSDTVQKLGDYLYGSGLVTNALLLFNIKTHINNSSENNFNRFPFKSFKITKWSVEHIHAQKSDGMNSLDQWNKWMEDSIIGLKKIEEIENVSNLIIEIQEHNNDKLSKEKFEELFNKVVKLTSDGSEMNEISNLALLDGKTNSSLSNNIFATKREMIIKAEKGNHYLPICTKNVFLKQYTKDPKQFYFWTNRDREDYFEAIKTTIS